MSFVTKNLKTQKKGKIADCYTKWQDIIRVLNSIEIHIKYINTTKMTQNNVLYIKKKHQNEQSNAGTNDLLTCGWKFIKIC